MDLVELAFYSFKDEASKGRKHLKNMIKNQFKDITDKQLNEVALRINNYQVEKYGGVLLINPDIRPMDELNKIQRQAKQREYAKRKYYENQGRR